ncbi:MAG: ribonuclease III, partial [Edafosvirus sp.]
MVLADYLYQRYGDQYEGFMTKLRTKLENGQSLAKLTTAIGLHKYVL